MSRKRVTTAQENRAAGRVELSRALNNTWLPEADCTQRQLADATGAQPSVVQRWCDWEARETLDVVDARNAPREVAVRAAQFILEPHGYHAVPKLAGGEVLDDLRHLAELVREAGESSTAIVEAVADGHVTPDEARRCHRELGELITIAAALQERMRAALEHRGEPVRRVQA